MNFADCLGGDILPRLDYLVHEAAMVGHIIFSPESLTIERKAFGFFLGGGVLSAEGKREDMPIIPAHAFCVGDLIAFMSQYRDSLECDAYVEIRYDYGVYRLDVATWHAYEHQAKSSCDLRGRLTYYDNRLKAILTV